MFLTALCPTFRHPRLLANSLALWNAQDHPADQRHLLILDDGGTFDTQRGEGFTVVSCESRFPSLPAKYNALLEFATSGTLGTPKPDGILIWEDDDVYLPGYASAHAAALTKGPFSKPPSVWCDASGQLAIEKCRGKFHSNMAFSSELITSLGGWPKTDRADFDLQLIGALNKKAGAPVDTWPDDAASPLFVYAWHTGEAHCQWTHKGPGDETWYQRAEQSYKKVPYVGKLEPKYDERTIKMLNQLGVSFGNT